MTNLERQISRVRKRLTTNLFLSRLALGLTLGSGVWALALLTERLFQLGIPLAAGIWIAAGLALTIALVGTWLAGVAPLRAALELDRAAGLKERVSTGLVCRANSDPFAQAAVHDAEKSAAGVHVPALVPYRAPRQWPAPLALVASAALLYWLMPQFNLLAADERDDAGDAESRQTERRQIEIELRTQQDRLRERLEDKPHLAGVLGDLTELEIPQDPGVTPDDIRRDVVKKVESVTDKLKEKLEQTDMKMLEALRADLAKLDAPRGDDAAARLAQAMAKGDMQEGRKALEDIKKQIEEASQSENLSPEQKAQLADMRRKLEDIAMQLQKLAEQEQRMQKELENKAGLSPDEAKRLLEQLKGADPKQIEKALQQALADKQVTPEQIKQMAQKLAQDRQVQQQLKQMGQAMQQAAQACQQGSGEGQGAAGAGGQMSLDAAMGMMSELEMAQQMMAELQAELSELKELKAGMCRNPGRRSDNGDQIGQQGPQEGLGYGAHTGKKAAAHGMKSTKAPSKITAGEIIGQMLIDGPQVKGELSAEVVAAVNAATRDATDAIEREEVPRQYEKVLREYFESLAGLVDGAKQAPAEAPASPAR